jgi:hypothetical protein
MDRKVIAIIFVLCLCVIASGIAVAIRGGKDKTPLGPTPIGPSGTTPSLTTPPAVAASPDVAVPPPAGAQMLKCINTSNRGSLGWVFKERVKTEDEARKLCAGSKYMSLECPTADGFEVFCANDISTADKLLDKECMGDVTGTALHGGQNLHCVGPYKWGNVNGGGANRGALYELKSDPQDVAASKTVNICENGQLCAKEMTSPNGRYVAITQTDGNYVVYESGVAIWNAGTAGKGTGPYRTFMQGDGNLVVYDSKDVPVWHAGSHGKGTAPYKLVMQDDGNLVVYDSASKATWSSKGGLVA